MASKLRRRPTALIWTRPPGRVLALMGLVGFMGSAVGEWDFNPSASGRITYSDNVSQSGSGESDLVTTLSAGAGMRQRAARINSSLNVNFQDVRHDNSASDDQMFTQLQGGSTWEAVKNRVFVGVNATISQQRIDDRGDIAVDNTTVTDNRTDVRTLSFSPRLTQPLGRFAVLRASTSISEVEFSTDTASGGQTQTSNVAIANGPRFNRLSWDMSITQSRDDQSDTTLNNVQIGTGYRVRPKLRLTFSTGFDADNFDTALPGSEESGNWNLGGTWTIDRRQTLSLAYGERFTTQNYSLSYARQGRYGQIAADYSEVRTTSNILQTEEFEIFDQNGNPVFSILLPSIATEVFLRKQMSASFTHGRGRTSWGARLNHQTREFQLAATKDEIVSLSGNLGYRFSDRVSSSLSASLQDQSFGVDGRNDEIFSLSGALSFDVGRDFGISLNVRHNRRDSSDATLNFDANTVSLGVTARF